MLRSEEQIKALLGEPATRTNVTSVEVEIWKWPCSCIAIRLDAKVLQWLPCAAHHPAESEQ